MKEYKEVVRAYAFWHVGFFAKYFLSHFCPLHFSRMHLDLLQKSQQRGQIEVIAAPRGHAKTTIRCLIDVIHDICYGMEDYILIISETATVGDDRVRDIKSELETNELLRFYFGDLIGEKWTETDIIANGVRVTSKGRGKQVRGLVWRGHRPSKVILDDIESPEGVKSPVQREKCWNWLMKDVMRAGTEATNYLFIGTFLHEEAALPRLTKISAYQSRVYKAVLSWAKRQDLWDSWRQQYVNLEDTAHKENAWAFFKEHEAEMMDGVKVLWPEKLSYYQIQEAIINTGRYAVNSELQNEPHDPETQIFDIEKVQRFLVEGDVGERYINHNGKRKPIASMRKIVFLDPALGSESGSSYPAIAVLASDDKGYTFILDSWMDKVPPSRQVIQAYEMAAKWKADNVGLETNLFKEYMEADFRSERERRKQRGDYWQVNIIPVYQSENKEDRISSLEPKISNGWILFNRVFSEEAIRQFEQFPTAAYNDFPDATEGGYSLLAQSKMKAMKVSMGGARRQ
jgi:predicted phage terminase large subunit-like protein